MSVKFTNLKGFQSDIDKLAKKLQIDVNIAVKKIAFDVYSGVAKKTPVDTGYARESWNITPNRADPSVAPSGSGDRRPVGNMSTTNHRKVVTADAKTRGGKKVQRWYITNNVPYIVELEAGHSPQSSHMVTRTLNEISRSVGIILREVGK